MVDDRIAAARTALRAGDAATGRALLDAARATAPPGDGAVMSGWRARAQTLLAETPDSVEAGWVALNRGMFDEDRARKEHGS